MAKKKLKTIVAGSLVKQVLYTPPTVRDTGSARGDKKRVSSAAQQRMNQQTSCEKLEWMLAANYRRGDLVVTLTFDDEHLPDTRQGVLRCLKKFRSSLSRVRRRKGKNPLVMVWGNPEHKHGDGRWHIHCVINATGADYADIRSCWPYGSDIEIKSFRLDKEQNYASLARYMCKERPEHLGQKQWSYTRTAAKPQVDTDWVDADTVIQAPKGSVVYQDTHERTEYASFHFIKYLAPGWDQQRAPHTRRKKK